jgi:hypothetical protein
MTWQTDGLRQILITETEVEDILKILDTSKATGPDCINPRLLRAAAPILKYPLSVIQLGREVCGHYRPVLIVHRRTCWTIQIFSMSSTTRLPLCSIGGIVRLHSLFPVKLLTKVHQFLLPALINGDFLTYQDVLHVARDFLGSPRSFLFTFFFKVYWKL